MTTVDASWPARVPAERVDTGHFGKDEPGVLPARAAGSVRDLAAPGIAYSLFSTGCAVPSPSVQPAMADVRSAAGPK